MVIERGFEMHREMVRYYYNHPSVIIWGTHNEIHSDLPESVEMFEKYYEYLKANGGNRLVTFACNLPMKSICYAYCDIICLNVYIGWYGKDTEEWPSFLEEFREKRAALGMEDKPVIMSEFGGAAIYGHHTFDNLKGTEEYQSELLRRCLTLFHDDPMIAGTYIWQFCDIRTAPQMGLDRARGYNNKGVVNEYRRPKASYHVVKELYRRFAEEKK